MAEKKAKQNAVTKQVSHTKPEMSSGATKL